MRVVIAGGGTGGHVFPGIAVAKELKKNFKEAEVVFVGTSEGIEVKIVPKEGFDIRFIKSEGIVRRGIFRSIKAFFKIPISIKESFTILKDIKPDVVFGVGGYCSGPVLFTAVLKGIPTMIHEQNTIPGFTNKLLGKFVDIVAVTYLESMDFFSKDKTYFTGNPVRDEILKGDRKRGHKNFHLDKNRFTIFVFGGSSGASKINKNVSEALTYIEDYKDKIQFLHQTGEKDFNFVREFYQARGFKGTIIPFTYDMADAYAVADLVISRAGATTIAELTACGKAAILVPYPFAAGNHQEVNARRLWDIGAAQMIHNRELSGRSLSDLIRYFIEDPDAIGETERISRSLGKPEATKKIVELMTGLVKRKKGEN
ncbi:MAG: undecaprenyldiphospho-muramoylpentapeptide beta-N-acetylglucosaminyltransferase [Thermodesulfovibrionia bacterium]|nr:undecaprenyldiphospho-muramoylpentapeptide beta-N-acetylglucosaminyltransferase [Thermodesulfovibrionia bacterium]